MGFAAGMRAGQLAVEGAIDQYNEVKRKRQMREVEEQIQAAQQANAERQYGIRTQDATTGMTPAQQQQAVMPQAPSATGMTPEQLSAAVGMGTARQMPPVGLSNEQRAAVGLPTAAPEVMSSAVGMAPEQVAGLMQEPRRGEQYTPMSQAAVERLRADKLRGLGYTEEADTALGRSLQLEEIDYQRKQDALTEARLNRGEGREDRRLQLAEDQAALTSKLTNLNIDVAELELGQMRDIDTALTTYQNFKGDLGEFMETPEWNKLGIKGQNAVVEGATGLASNLQTLGTLNIQRELSKATDLPSMVEAANRLSATDGIDIRATIDEDTNKVTLSSIYTDVTADNYQQERGKPKTFDTPEEAMRYIAEMAKDPILGADNFIQREKEAAALVAATTQQGLANAETFINTRLAVIEALLGEGSVQTYAALGGSQKTAFDGEVARIMAPLLALTGIPAEQMGGMPDAGADMRTGGPQYATKDAESSLDFRPVNIEQLGLVR